MVGTAYRVIEILDKYSVIINYGKLKGANKGDTIRIVEIGPEIRDIDTDLLLGTLDRIKAELSIEVVYDNFSICRSIETLVNNVLVNPLNQFQVKSKRLVELFVNEADISGKQFPEKMPIKVGDKVEIM